MPRKTHKVIPEEESVEGITVATQVMFTPTMRAFLEIEAKRMSGNSRSQYSIQDVVRALVTAYYEKRMIGLMVDPND